MKKKGAEKMGNKTKRDMPPGQEVIIGIPDGTS